jgi:hypothetical protein
MDPLFSPSDDVDGEDPECGRTSSSSSDEQMTLRFGAIRLFRGESTDETVLIEEAIVMGELNAAGDDGPAGDCKAIASSGARGLSSFGRIRKEKACGFLGVLRIELISSKSSIWIGFSAFPA